MARRHAMAPSRSASYVRPASAAGSFRHDQQGVGGGHWSQLRGCPPCSSPSAPRASCTRRLAAPRPSACARWRPPAGHPPAARQAEHAADQRSREQLEGDEGADRVTGQADRHAGNRAEGERLARLHADLARSRASPGARSCRARGRGARPTRRRRRSAGRPRPRHAGPAARSAPGRPARAPGRRLAARLGDGRRQGDPVGVVDLARGQRRARRLQLVAGRQDRDEGRRRTASSPTPSDASRPSVAVSSSFGRVTASPAACRGPCDGRRRPAPWRARPRPLTLLHHLDRRHRRPRRAASERRS